PPFPPTTTPTHTATTLSTPAHQRARTLPNGRFFESSQSLQSLANAFPRSDSIGDSIPAWRFVVLPPFGVWARAVLLFLLDRPRRAVSLVEIISAFVHPSCLAPRGVRTLLHRAPNRIITKDSGKEQQCSFLLLVRSCNPRPRPLPQYPQSKCGRLRAVSYWWWPHVMFVCLGLRAARLQMNSHPHIPVRLSPAIAFERQSTLLQSSWTQASCSSNLCCTVQLPLQCWKQKK
ncbi:hypothetical protein CAOG_09068, partial [Capsaspora owczarzaki ATCC 30864]|uniref:hypothetical protein n=1 Tax=Capsaspora owczarzaki (strain ATCC 30864) TaxID=595528 RepID=UPI0003521D5B